jgi:hypothetical protein
MKVGGNVVAAVIQSLPASSSTTTWTRRRPGRLGGDDARYWWLSCAKEGGVGDKCLAAPRAEAEKKLGEEMLSAHQLKGGGGGGVRRHRHGCDRGRRWSGDVAARAGRKQERGTRGPVWGKRKENGSGPSE